MENKYLDFLIDPSFQEVNRLFFLSFKDNDSRESHKQFNDGRNFFYQPIKNVLKTFGNIKKFATGQGDDYTTGCLLDHPYFKNYYKLIAIDLTLKQLGGRVNLYLEFKRCIF